MRNGSLGGRGNGVTAPGAGSKLVAALDIGSTKICCIIAEHSSEKRGTERDVRPSLKVVGFGQTASRGIRNGAVVHLDEAERAIRHAVDLAERQAQRRISEVYVNVTGGRAGSILGAGRVSTQTGVVSPRDVDNAVSAAIASVDVGRRHVLHLMPIGFDLDGVPCGVEPLGLHGQALTAEVGVVTVEPSSINNHAMAIERSHLAASGFALAPYAAARGILAPDELSMGALVIDMGGATTSIALFKEGRLASATVIPLGGTHVTNDIAHGLTTTIAHAERMKTMFGTVLSNGHDDREMLAVPLVGERGVDTVQKVPRHALTAIIKPRLEETFDLISQYLAAEPGLAAAAGRVVITGGASQLQGVREMASAVLGRQARLGSPMGLQGLPEVGRGAGFAVAAGLLSIAARPDRLYAMPKQAQAAIDRSQLSYARKVGRWLVEAL